MTSKRTYNKMKKKNLSWEQGIVQFPPRIFSLIPVLPGLDLIDSNEIALLAI